MRVIFFLLASWGAFFSVFSQENLITCKGIGKVHLQASHNDLKKMYGEKNVIHDTLDYRMVGYSLPPGSLYYEIITTVNTPSGKIKIRWKKGVPENGIQEISTESSNFRFENGVYAGMKLSEFLKINQSDIRFYGFGWQFAGQLVNNNQGKHFEKYPCFASYLKLVNEGDYRKVSNFVGDRTFSTNQSGLPVYDIVLGEIRIVAK